MEKIKAYISKTRFWVLVAVVLMVIIAVVVIFKKAENAEETPYEKNRKTVAALEKADISHTENALKDLESRDGSEGSQGEERDTVELKRAFQNAVILGDSFSESIVEYGFLDTDVVLYKRGLSVSQADDLVDNAISLRPSAVFFVFGTNDMEICEGDSKKFIEAYRRQIGRLKEGLPDAAVYINSILPATKEAVKETPSYAYCEAFNEALQAMCEEDGYTFVDCTFLIEGKDGIYAAALLVEMIAVNGKKLSEILKDIEAECGAIFMEERDYKFNQEKRDEIFSRLMIQKNLPEIEFEVDKISYLDGCKVYLKNGGLIIARFSGTEPLLRIFCEMSNAEDAKYLCERFEEFLGLK